MLVIKRSAEVLVCYSMIWKDVAIRYWDVWRCLPCFCICLYWKIHHKKV